MVPETKFSTPKYELREIGAALSPIKIHLIEKGLLTEKSLGFSNDAAITFKDITGLNFVRQAGDTTFAWVKSGGISYKIAFHK